MTFPHAGPLFARLADAGLILVAGAGGGFDLCSGLPLALSLRHQEAHLAGPSFSALAGLPAEDRATPDLALITPAPHRTRTACRIAFTAR